MRVFLTNDDGIRAPGIEALYHALAGRGGVAGGPIGEVIWPIAPLTVQSATSHGVTFHEPLMVSRVSVFGGVEGVAVDGRPADCVKLGICALWPERFGNGARPDLVVSGMNAGTNVGINVLYSGTVAAAIEAAFLGVPSVAVSMHIGKGRTDFDRGAALARGVIDRVVASGLLNAHSCVSINIPLFEAGDGREGERPPVRVCPMNTHGMIDNYERRVSPAGDVYYWPASEDLDFVGADEGTDLALLLDRCITVTPLYYDLTRVSELAAWREAMDG